jgi:hypothetical protein
LKQLEAADSVTDHKVNPRDTWKMVGEKDEIGAR